MLNRSISSSQEAFGSLLASHSGFPVLIRSAEIMKSFLVLALAIVATPNCFAVSNDVIGDLEELKKIGFEFTNVSQSAEGLVTFSLIAPSHYTFEDGEFKFTKQFSELFFLRTLKVVDHGPRLIGAPATRFNLLCREREDSRHESRITLLASDTRNCFFAVSFVEGPGSWPMIIHIPVSKLLRQIEEAERDDAGQSAAVLESKTEGKDKIKPDSEGRSQ